MSGRGFARLSDGYELLEKIGGGGMATIYSARDLGLGRTVAIKVVRGAMHKDEEAVERLLREARAVASLNHPNVLSLFGIRLSDEDDLCLIMPLVTDGTLRDELDREGQLPVARVSEVLVQLLKALEHAHARGIVHRDIKPENIFLGADDGRVLLGDFGIARSVSEEGLTMTGTSLGTPNYMAPEQIQGSEVDGRADLYSLGMLAFELLTGQRPWQGETLYSVIRKQWEEDLPPIQSLRSDVPATLCSTIEKATAKAPEDRWADALAMRRALETRSTLPPPAHPVAASTNEPEPLRTDSIPTSAPTVRLAASREEASPSMGGSRRIGRVGSLEPLRNNDEPDDPPGLGSWFAVGLPLIALLAAFWVLMARESSELATSEGLDRQGFSAVQETAPTNPRPSPAQRPAAPDCQLESADYRALERMGESLVRSYERFIRIQNEIYGVGLTIDLGYVYTILQNEPIRGSGPSIAGHMQGELLRSLVHDVDDLSRAQSNVLQARLGLDRRTVARLIHMGGRHAEC